MELSLGNKDDEANFHSGGCSSSGGSHGGLTGNKDEPVEKEHMFDKVVTPSDVGKLNRLVIPKQHAEKYFPLDSSTNEKGLLLNFEDRNGKLWRFRYSYWNSSQSYVMTKGWSRFVKEKKLDAGDIVSFQRGAGDLYRHRLYIDWRRRPDHVHDPTAALLSPFLLQNQPHLSQYSLRWSGRLFSLPSPPSMAVPRHHHQQEHFQQLNYGNMYPFHQQHLHPPPPHHRLQNQYQNNQNHNYIGSHQNYGEPNSGSGSLYYLRPAVSMADRSLPGRPEGGGNSGMIIDSVPVGNHGNSSTSSTTSATTGKRLRLFGVNMECASSPADQDPKCCLVSPNSVDNVSMANYLPSSSSLHLRTSHEDLRIPYEDLRVPHEDHPVLSSSYSNQARFGEKLGESSMHFDLDPSLQYRR